MIQVKRNLSTANGNQSVSGASLTHLALEVRAEFFSLPRNGNEGFSQTVVMVNSAANLFKPLRQVQKNSRR